MCCQIHSHWLCSSLLHQSYVIISTTVPHSAQTVSQTHHRGKVCYHKIGKPAPGVTHSCMELPQASSNCKLVSFIAQDDTLLYSYLLYIHPPTDAACNSIRCSLSVTAAGHTGQRWQIVLLTLHRWRPHPFLTRYLQRPKVTPADLHHVLAELLPVPRPP